MGTMSYIVAMFYVAVRYWVWIVSGITVPLLSATLFCIVLNPTSAQAKITLVVNTFRFLILSKDKKWTKSDANPASFFPKDGDSNDRTFTETFTCGVVQKKTVIFLRHGESTWNDTFNKGDRKMLPFLIGFLPGLLYSLATEWYFLIRGQSEESWFFDSPLSPNGIKQAEAVAKFIRETDLKYATPKEAKFLRLIKGGDEMDESAATSTMDKNIDGSGSNGSKCVLVSSNLRRAISTCAIAMKGRLDQRIPGDKIIILQELQEASVNPDAQSISPSFGELVLSCTDSDYCKEIYKTQTNTNFNKGNKDLKSNGLKRMESFCNLLFDVDVGNENKEKIQSSVLGDAKHVLCTGHSYWFRAFFQTYLPSDFHHICKTKKLINGGMIGFTFCHTQVRFNGNIENKFMIDPNSLVVLYGGF